MKKHLLLVVMALLPLVASADASGTCGDNLTWTYVESTGTLTISGTGSMENFYETAAPWYSYSIKKVIIEDGITSIGSCAFWAGSGLTSVEIPNSVTSIGEAAFNGCSGLTSVTIPNSVTSIGGWAFCDCSGLTSVTIPNSVTSIGKAAFGGCSGLTSVTIGNSVTSIGTSAFEGCSGLTSINIPNGVTSIDYRTFYNCSSLTSVTIPNSVISIGSYAFSGCSSLTAVTIPNSVTSIGVGAFGRCSGLTSVTIGNSVTSIGDHTFQNCSCLTSVTIGNSVTSIGNYAFHNCGGLTSVTIGNSVTSIGEGAFSVCGLTSVTIPNSVTSIGENAFAGCSVLTSVTIGNSVISIGRDAFSSCTNLTSVHITDLDAWCKIVFSGCNSNPLYYAHHLFLNGNEVKDLVIPNSVTTINGAFAGCSGLTSITIGNSVTSIGSNAFSYCSGLISVTIPNSVISIGGSAFWGCSGLTSVTIGNSVTSIGVYAFDGCSGLTFVTIPNSVTSIGNSAFSGCSGLTSITIPNSVTSIGESAFSGCSKASSLKLPDNIMIIKASTFYGCKSLKTVVIPASVEFIYQNAFAGCTGLESVKVLAETPPFLYDNSFSNYNIPLYAPASAIESYQSQSPWSKFSQFMTLDGTEIEIKKCATPTIAYKDGKISFSCDTENVQFVYQITDTDISQGNAAEVNLSATYRVSVRATRTGYEDSDVATATYSWNGIAPLMEGAVAKYRLSFIVDNKELSVQNIAYGSQITAPTTDSEGNTVTWYTYPATMPAHDLVVYGMVPKAAAPTKYTITYVLDGQTYRSVTVDEGATVSKEKAPYKEGYTFNGWQNEPTTMPGRNVTVSGSFSVNSYRLSFIVDNQELSARNVTYGATITPPTTDSEGNTVSWYTHPTTMPAHDLVVYGMAVKEPEPELFAWLTVNDSRSGYTKIKVKQGAEQTLNITAEEGWKISNIFMDGRYMTTRLQEDGTFVTPVITGDTSIIIVYEEEAPSGVRTAHSQADIKVVSDGVVISNAEPQSRCVIYSSDGQQVVNTVINDGTRKIALQQGQVYILTINGRTLKFAL